MGQIDANWYFALIMQDRYYKYGNWLRHQYDLPIKEEKLLKDQIFIINYLMNCLFLKDVFSIY